MAAAEANTGYDLTGSELVLSDLKLVIEGKPVEPQEVVQVITTKKEDDGYKSKFFISLVVSVIIIMLLLITLGVLFLMVFKKKKQFKHYADDNQAFEKRMEIQKKNTVESELNAQEPQRNI